MAKTTSFILGDELDAFVRGEVASGRFSSASEVVRVALERLADEHRKQEFVREALEHGRRSGRAADGVFDRVLERMHARARELGKLA